MSTCNFFFFLYDGNCYYQSGIHRCCNLPHWHQNLILIPKFLYTHIVSYLDINSPNRLLLTYNSAQTRKTLFACVLLSCRVLGSSGPPYKIDFLFKHLLSFTWIIHAGQIKNTRREKKKSAFMMKIKCAYWMMQHRVSNLTFLFTHLLGVFPSWKNSKFKLTLTLSHIFCYIWGFCPVKSALANPFHFKQVQAADSFRTRGTYLMHDSSQMTAPAGDLQFRGRLGTVEHTDMVMFDFAARAEKKKKKICPSIFSNCTVAAGAGAEDISICFPCLAGFMSFHSFRRCSQETLFTSMWDYFKLALSSSSIFKKESNFLPLC